MLYPSTDGPVNPTANYVINGVIYGPNLVLQPGQLGYDTAIGQYVLGFTWGTGILPSTVPWGTPPVTVRPVSPYIGQTIVFFQAGRNILQVWDGYVWCSLWHPSARGIAANVALNTAGNFPLPISGFDYDTDGVFTINSSIININRAGIYTLSANGTFVTPGLGDFVGFQFYHNSVEILPTTTDQVGVNANNQTVYKTSSTRCAAGDTLEVRVRHTAGSATNFVNGEIAVARIADVYP